MTWEVITDPELFHKVGVPEKVELEDDGFSCQGLGQIICWENHSSCQGIEITGITGNLEFKTLKHSQYLTLKCSW